MSGLILGERRFAGLLTDAGSGPLNLGVAATPHHSIGTGGVLIGDRLEVHAQTDIDGALNLYDQLNFNVGTLFYASMKPRPDNGLILGLDNTDGRANHNFIITSGPNAGSSHGLTTLSAHPSIVLFSGTQPLAQSEYGKIFRSAEALEFHTGGDGHIYLAPGGSGVIKCSSLITDAGSGPLVLGIDATPTWVGAGDVLVGQDIEVGGVTHLGNKLRAESVLSESTGDEYAAKIEYTVDKATSGNDYGLYIDMTDTLSPGSSYPLWVGANGEFILRVEGPTKYTYTRGIYNAGHIQVTGNLLLNNGGDITSTANGDVIGDPHGFGNFLVDAEDKTHAFLVGNHTKVGSLTDCTSNGTATITKSGHGLSVAAGDLVHITDATTAADEGFYRLVSFTADTLVVDRALTGSDADVDLKVYKDVVAFFGTDGTRGQLIQGYSHQDKPLQLGGEIAVTVGTSAPADADLEAGQYIAWIDETGNTLNWKVKYSDGTTIKSGSVSLT